MKTKNIIAKLVEPLKDDAIKYARVAAETFVQHITTIVEDAGGDINKAAPYPDSFRMGRNDYLRAKERYNDVHRLVTSDKTKPHSYMRNAPSYVVMCPLKIAAYIKQQEEMAAAQYDAFVLKLTYKIGEGVTTAGLEGNHVWGESYLTVNFADKPTEVWKTQLINNRTKLGLWFIQFPSRIVKHKRARKSRR